MSISTELFARSAARSVRESPVPIRLPSYNRPAFWSKPLNITRCRPLPAQAGWTDLIVVPDMPGYPRVIQEFILTSQTRDVVAFRWIYKGTLLTGTDFTLAPTVERHLDRNIANPYPCHYRQVALRADDISDLRIQVMNLTGVIQLVFGAVIGWYYPNRGHGEVTQMEGVDDQAR